MDPASKRDRLQRFEALCRQRRLSLTVQRRVILEAVLDLPDHPTADAIHDAVRDRIPGLSRTTVYRVLDTLVGLGMITKACSPGGTSRFDAMTHRHHHLICTRCETLIDLEDQQLNQAVQLPAVAAGTFEIEGYSIHFHGVCAACRRRTGSNKSSSHKSRKKTRRIAKATQRSAKKTKKSRM